MLRANLKQSQEESHEEPTTSSVVCKTIKVSPETIIFSQVVPGQPQTETVTLTNTLGAPVDLILKCSNPDRLEVVPKSVRLVQSQSVKVEVRLLQPKAFHTKAVKVKDYLFIKGEYFDQKLQIVIYPTSSKTSTSTNSLQRAADERIPLAGDSFGRGAHQNTTTHQSSELQSTQHQVLRSSFDGEDSEDDENEFLREKLASLSLDNLNLREKLDQTQSDLAQLRNQQSFQLESIRETLRQKEPNFEKLLDEAMKVERKRTEVKEQKVLAILQQKDRTIDDLQRALSELESKSQDLKSLSTKHEQTQHKLDQSQALVQRLELKVAELQAMLQDFSQTDLMKNQAQLLSQAAYIKDLESKIKSAQNFELMLENTAHELKLKETQLSQLKRDLEQAQVQDSVHDSQIYEAIQILSQITGHEFDSVVEAATECCKEFTRVQKLNAANTEAKLNAQEQELIQLRQLVSKSTIGGHSSKAENNSNAIYVEENFQLDQTSLVSQLREMKIREERLIDEISVMRQKMKYQSCSDDYLVTENDSSQQDAKADHWLVRVAELEAVVFRQRERLIAQEQELADTKRQHQSELFNSLLTKSPQMTQDTERDLKLNNPIINVVTKNNQATNELKKQGALLKHELFVQDFTNTTTPKQASSSSVQNNNVQSSLVSIRDEYLQRLEQITSQYELARQNMHTASLDQQQLVVQLETKLLSEKDRNDQLGKEIQQLTCKLQLKQQGHDDQIQQLESVINSCKLQLEEKEQQLAEAELVVAERQEQLSVLLSALDAPQATHSEQQVKLTNLAAEVCSLVTDRQQLQIKCKNYQNQSQSAHLKAAKLQHQLEQNAQQAVELQSKLKTATQHNEQHLRTQQRLERQVKEAQSRVNELTQQNERSHFLLKQNNDLIQSQKVQLQRQEQQFKSAVGQFKSQQLQKANQQPVQDQSFRLALDRLSLQLKSQSQPNFEQTLQQAAESMAQLERQLQRERERTRALEQEIDAFASNEIMTARHEFHLTYHQQLKSHYEEQFLQQAVSLQQQQRQSDQLVERLQNELQQSELHKSEVREKYACQKQLNCQLQAANDQLRQRVALVDAQLAAQAEAQRIHADFDDKFAPQSNSDSASLQTQNLNLKKRLQLEQAKLDACQQQLSTVQHQLHESQQSIRSLQSKLSQQHLKHQQQLQNKQQLFQYDAQSSQTQVQMLEFRAFPDIQFPECKPDSSLKIQQLQEDLIDLKQSHAAEIDQLTQAFQLQLQEQQLQLQNDRKKAPSNQSDELRSALAACEQRCEQIAKECDDLKQALVDFDFTSQQHQDLKRSKNKRNNIEFVRNPPMIIKALVQAKLSEVYCRAKLRRQLQTELYLRQQLAQRQPPSELVSNLINQNDALLEILTKQTTPTAALFSQSDDVQHEADDYDCLVRTVVELAHQLAVRECSQLPDHIQVHEQLPAEKIMQAQRVVIKSLARKSLGQEEKIRYAPEREHDRKIWLLELLEQQVGDAEVQTDRLIDFVKRLQVAVSGNLQSAAEVRATSIDLANNTNQASEELKSLRHVAALIKHEIQQQTAAGSSSQVLLSRNNPFTDTVNERSIHSTSEKTNNNNSVYDRVMCERDNAQSQLSLTSKIKQSLEQELISLKLAHVSELQTQLQHYKHLQHQHNAKLDLCEQQDAKIAELQSALQTSNQLSDELSSKLKQEERHVQALEQKLEKQAGSSNSLRRLQQDVADWRKQADANVKAKQDQLDSQHQELAGLKRDNAKLKSENQMLRRVAQDQRNGETTTHLLKEIEQSKAQITALEGQLASVSAQKIEEHTQQQERISQLEKVIAQGDCMAAQDVQKLSKRVLIVQQELKSRQEELQTYQEKLTQSQQAYKKLEIKLQESESTINSLQDKIQNLKNQLQQANQDKQELFKQKVQALDSQDSGVMQLAEEMVQLRETFLRLKQERDLLAEQIQMSQEHHQKREREWQQQVRELEQRPVKHVDQDTAKVLEERNRALIADLKYFKEQNHSLQDKFQAQVQSTAQHDSVVLGLTQELQSAKTKVQEALKEVQKLKTEIRELEMSVKRADLERAEVESSYCEQLRLLQTSTHKQRVESSMQIQALAIQITSLKKGAKPAQLDQALQLVQKDALIKQLKKDVVQEKQKSLKLKQQRQEEQLVVAESKGKKQQLPKWQEEIIEMVSEAHKFKKALKTVQDNNQQAMRLIDLETQLQSAQTQLQTSTQQQEILQLQLDEMQQQILDQKSSAKDGKSQLVEKHHQQVQGLKDQCKQLQSELARIKAEFVSPDDQQSLIEQIKDYQASIKQREGDMQRKQKLIVSLRGQKDNLQQELDLLMGDVKGLKDENTRLHKQLKEGKSSNSELKEMRETYEWLSRQEKQLKEELVSMHEKNKCLKQDLARKDSQISQYKDQCHQKSKDSDQCKELLKEIERLKEDKKRLKLELDICRDQLKTLKQPTHQNQQHDSQTSTVEQRSSKKSRKIESTLKKSVQVIQRVGTEIARLVPNDFSDQTQNAAQDQSHEYFRDAGEILGVSINELEDFMNPSAKKSGRSTESDQQRLVNRLSNLQSVPVDTLEYDIEEIGEYCCKLLSDLQK